MSQGEVMDGRPTTEVAREEALELAQRIAAAADGVSASDGASRRAAIRRLNGATDNQYGVVRIARALLSTSTAMREMREVLKKTPCFGCGVRFGDNQDSALSCVRGCVNCKDQRAALAAIEKATKP